MRHLLALILLLPLAAHAEILVRHCQTPGTCTWVRPADATQVQVNRAGSPIVELATVLPTERIAACYDGAVVGATSCTTRVPGRNDLWQLKSELYPTDTGEIRVTWPAVTTDDKGAPLTGITYSLYGGVEGQETLKESGLAVTTSLRTGAAYNVRYCYFVRAVWQGIESADSPRGCLTLPKDIRKPSSPVSIELKSTSTAQP